MSCSIAVSNICHSTFSTSNTWVNVDSPSNDFCQHPLDNLMVKFEQRVDTSISTTNHHRKPLMKRRRPAKISIPVSNLSHLVDIDAKSSSDNDELLEIEVEGDGYGVFCKKGKSRTHLEDRYSAILNTIPGHTTKQAFFGIFDGHGGARAAEFTAKRLGSKILENVGSSKSAKNEEGKCKKATMEDDIRGCFLEVDKEFISTSSSSSSSDNATDSSGGTCCITAFIEGGTLMVSNLGDCRAVISRGGVAEPLSVDHTPARHDEKLRIQSKGGYVDECSGVWRVQGTLGVSRAIGDRGLKQWVIAEPETKTMSIQPDCDFLILASDGLWNKVTNQEAVDVVVAFCTATATALDNNGRELITRSTSGACRKLVELSMSRGSNDDASVLIIHLARFLVG